jgi:hypothetical protein
LQQQRAAIEAMKRRVDHFNALTDWILNASRRVPPRIDVTCDEYTGACDVVVRREPSRLVRVHDEYQIRGMDL